MAGPAATGYHPPPTRQRLACPALPLPWTRRSMPCPALPLPCLALFCLALLCPALPCPALPLPCHALPSHLPCPALPCPALPCLAPALQRPRSACVGPHGERSACRTTASRSQGTQWEPPRMTWTRTAACQTERPATPRQSSPQPRSHEDGPGAARPNGLSQSETGTRRGQMQALLHMIQQQQAVSRLAERVAALEAHCWNPCWHGPSASTWTWQRCEPTPPWPAPGLPKTRPSGRPQASVQQPGCH